MKSSLSQRRPVGYYTTELSRYSLTPVRVPAGYLRVTCGVPAVYLRGTCGVPAEYLRGTCGVPAGYLQGTCIPLTLSYLDLILFISRQHRETCLIYQT